MGEAHLPKFVLGSRDLTFENTSIFSKPEPPIIAIFLFGISDLLESKGKNLRHSKASEKDSNYLRSHDIKILYFCAMTEIKKVAFAGSGNVVTHLSKVFFNADIKIIGFYGRNLQSAQSLANKYNTYFGQLQDLEACDADLIIVSVPDHAINEVISLIPNCDTMMAHTSGSLSIEVLQKVSKHPAVFYPLQTFSKDKTIDFSQVPIMLEAKKEDDYLKLENLANKISKKIFRINSSQRKKIHIAAVFSSNFTNYLFHIAEDLLRREEVPFEVIQPLIEETTEKIKELRPFDAQTGPAARRDMETIYAHLNDLKEIPEYQEIYKLLSHHIIKSRE